MKKILIFLTVFLLSNAAQAGTYFAGEAIDPNLLGKPLDQDSPERKDEIQKIIKLQQNPDTNELKQAQAESGVNPEHVTLMVDAKLTEKSFPKLYHLLERAQDTSSSTTHNAKKYWNIKRPFLTDKKIKLLVSRLTIGELAYPSGHTTAAYTTARICGLLIPKKSEEFLARANRIANHRVLVGAHFPSDLEAGRKLSLLIIGGLLQNVEFQKDFKEAQIELEAKYE